VMNARRSVGVVVVRLVASLGRRRDEVRTDMLR
jgi:hypothetical protein